MTSLLTALVKLSCSNGNPLQYPCLENPMDRGSFPVGSSPWVAKSRTQLSYFTFPFPGGSDGKESPRNEGDPTSIPGLGRSPGEGNSYPCQYSCLENSMDRGALQVPVHGVSESDITERLSVYFTFIPYSLLPLLVDQETLNMDCLLISVFTIYSKNCKWEGRTKILSILVEKILLTHEFPHK